MRSYSDKKNTLSNTKRQEDEDKKSNIKIKEEHGFFEPPDEFEEELVQGLFKNIEHKKIEHPYVEPQVQDAETIETETKKEDDKLFDIEKKCNEIDDAATEQKKQNTIIDLIDDVLDENNPFNKTMKT